MEIPGLVVKSELQLSAYTTATATPDAGHPKPQLAATPSEGRDQTLILMDTVSGS